MDDKRGFSLRQKKAPRRPAISAPKQVSSQSTPAPPPSQAHPRVNGLREKTANTSREQLNRPGERTADLVKRRYSTRFGQLPDFNGADAPPLPNAHHANQNPKLNLPLPGPAQNIDVDIAALKDPNLDAEKCKRTLQPPSGNVLKSCRHRYQDSAC